MDSFVCDPSDRLDRRLYHVSCRQWTNSPVAGFRGDFAYLAFRLGTTHSLNSHVPGRIFNFESEYQGGYLNSQELQGKYLAAVTRITAPSKLGIERRRAPIFQRDRVVNEKQSIQDAATALATLWKIAKR